MRPFGRTFWICLFAATILAAIGLVVALHVPADLHPRYPGQRVAK